MAACVLANQEWMGNSQTHSDGQTFPSLTDLQHRTPATYWQDSINPAAAAAWHYTLRIDNQLAVTA